MSWQISSGTFFSGNAPVEFNNWSPLANETVDDAAMTCAVDSLAPGLFSGVRVLALIGVKGNHPATAGNIW
jgi:hypothetical protein